MKKRRKAGFIVFNNEKTKVLLVKQKYYDEYPKWGCPKGHREETESLIDTGIRELHEETGLMLNKQQMYKFVNICNTCYYIYTLDCEYIPRVNDNREISEASFITIDKIPNINTNLELKKIYENIQQLVEVNY